MEGRLTVPDFGRSRGSRGAGAKRPHGRHNHGAKTGQVFATGTQLIRPAQGLPVPRRGLAQATGAWLVASSPGQGCWLPVSTLMCLSTEPPTRSHETTTYSFGDTNE